MDSQNKSKHHNIDVNTKSFFKKYDKQEGNLKVLFQLQMEFLVRYLIRLTRCYHERATPFGRPVVRTCKYCILNLWFN
jgi:hypothetical protein